jgi:hypothetical protein
MPGFVWLLLAIFGSSLVTMGLLVGVRMVEKRLAWPYAPAEEDTKRTSYIDTTARLAQERGFQPIAALRAAKGGIYAVRYELWLAGDRETLLLIGGGRLAGIAVDGSWLFTMLRDGRRFVTLDDEKGSEPDLTGRVDEAIHRRLALPALLETHRRRVAAAGGAVQPYSERDALAEHRDALKRRIDTLVGMGYARFVDPARSTWVYTLRGAAVITLRAYVGGMRRAFRL